MVEDLEDLLWIDQSGPGPLFTFPIRAAFSCMETDDVKEPQHHIGP
jgi:hypothetical protein